MTDYTELQKAAAYAAQDTIKFADEDEEIRALQQFHEEVDPETVLALIAENEELGRYLCTCRDCGGEGALHTGDWHSYGHMEPPEPVMEKCGECEGTGLLGKIQDLYQVITERDQLKAENEIFEEGMRSLACSLSAGGYNATTLDATQLVEKVQWGVDRLADTSGHLADQLRAEIAGLKTGYEAYERVNAELKADNEALRAKLENPDPILIQCLDAAIAEQEQLKRCAGRYEWLRDKQTFIWLIQDWFPSDAEFTDVDAVIDAAMGQGERS